MDIASLVGIIGAFGIVIAAMVTGGDIGVFVNVPSLLIVIGGSLFVVLMKFPLAHFLAVGKVVGKAFKFKSVKPEDIIAETVDLADAARKGGLLSLEDKEVSTDFMQRGIQLLVDGHDPDIVKALLNKEKGLTTERHEYGSDIFKAIGDVGPGMGMIGTLVGLVQMLSNMSDPKSIGPAMAVALLTTLYGAMLATMFALPVSDKLDARKAEEELNQSLIIDGLLAIQAGQNPRVIEQMLRNYLPEKKRAVAEE
ncbi:flagellar motor protein PomA [Amphritea japonica]|uniref:Chemotaxis protein MotA n=1 Tax=Amphritea japonica ATCC BAA-1530 TaxID=1278309 RepID=A0A7R6SR68_9GAMM|nr:flagellar motor protein PomA [Amphritea japonica]BBB24929.1 chemotaxis protein MotA [Amphritea japonica ATCC BAA-1530]